MVKDFFIRKTLQITVHLLTSSLSAFYPFGSLVACQMLDYFYFSYIVFMFLANKICCCCCCLPTRRYASAGLCDSNVSERPSLCHTPLLCLAERKQDREMYTI